MVKKAKKGGKSPKGKGKGKKGKEGKKGVSRDDELKTAVINARLWQQKLQLTERQRDDYRETCRKLASENESLSDALYQAERDTIDVISHLKRDDITKDKKIFSLTQLTEQLQVETSKNRNEMEDEYSIKARKFEEIVSEKTSEIALLQKELRGVKEFRKNKTQVTEELRELYDQLKLQKNENETQKRKMEHKFFEEKRKMEREASHKIGQFAERAQREAIAGLDETTRKVFRDNVRMSEVVGHHIEENNQLREKVKKLETKLSSTQQELEINEITVRTKIAESRKANDEIRILRNNLNTLNHDFNHEKDQHKNDRALALTSTAQQSAVDKADIARLNQTLALREREMKKVKMLAKKIISDRTEMERFFIDALDQVCKEIDASRTQYVKTARSHYHQQMAAAASGGSSTLPPMVKSFSPGGKANSTNHVSQDLSAAEDWTAITARTDIADLTWEQKEKVIRLLFARMNGVAREKKARLPPIKSGDSNGCRKVDSKPHSGNSLMSGRHASARSILSEVDSINSGNKNQNEIGDDPTQSQVFITQ